MVSRELFERYYAEPKYDGTAVFYQWIRDVTDAEHRVLNLGAGPASRKSVRCLKGEVAEVIGADIDPIVLQNDELDSAIIIENGRIPLPDRYFDLVYSDYVLEHVEKPSEFLSEVYRLLRPGGAFMFRTPNIFHYVTLISRFSSHSLHERIANQARGLSEEAHEPWPTYYRMNSRSKLKALAAEAGFDRVELRMIECEPSYMMFHVAPFLVGVAYERLVNSTEFFQDFRVNIFGRLLR